jgi:hypothetical protein
MQKERNTDQHSLARIYVRSYFSWFNFDYNNPGNNRAKMLEWFEKVDALAKEKKIEDVQIVPSCDRDSDNDDILQLGAVGHRLETDEEYERRINWMLESRKNAYKAWEEKKAYYTSEAYRHQMKTLEALLGLMKNAEPSCH